MGAKKAALVDDIAAVCARVGLDAVTVDADEAEVTRPAKGAKVGFLDALETALTTLIGPSNGKPGYDSAPWDYVTSVPESFGLASGAKEDEIRAAVREVVNQRGTTIHLLCPGDYEEETVRTGIFAPFSHDAKAMPEPAAVVGLLTLGIGGLIGRSRVFRRK